MVSLPSDLLILLFFLFVFVVSSFYFTSKRRPFSRNDFADFLLIDDIRDSKHCFPRYPSKVVTEGTYGHPFIPHWILSFLPKETVSAYRFFKSVLNALFIVLILSLTFTDFLTLGETVVAVGVFVFTPSFVLPAEGGVGKRTAGALVVSVSLLSLVYWFETGNVAFLIISIVSGGLAHLTYSPASYFYIGTTVLFSIAFGSWAFAVLLASIVIATFFSGGAYLRIFYAEARSWYDGVFRQYVYSYNPNTRRRLVVDGLACNPFVVAVIGFYVLVFSFVGSLPPLVPGFHIWIVGGLIGVVGSTIVGEEFAGTPGAYLQFTFIPGAAVLARGLSSFDSVYGLVVVLTALTGIVVIYVYSKRTSRKENEEWSEIIEFLREQNEGVVMIQPSLRGLGLAYRTPHYILDHVMNAETGANQTRNIFPSTYLNFTKDIFMLKYRYNPDWLIIDKKAAGRNSLTLPDRVKPVLENEGYALYFFDDVYSRAITEKRQTALE